MLVVTATYSGCCGRLTITTITVTLSANVIFVEIKNSPTLRVTPNSKTPAHIRYPAIHFGQGVLSVSSLYVFLTCSELLCALSSLNRLVVGILPVLPWPRRLSCKGCL